LTNKGFFDDYDSFYKTSSTGSAANRLNSRHRVLIGKHLSCFRDKVVLDLGCHDARWSFAAHKAGARHVIGIEARPRLVEAARLNIQRYGVSERVVQIVEGDVYDVVPQLKPDTIDTVLCLGFFYHTAHHTQLLDLLAGLRVRHILLDTAIIRSPLAMVRLHLERTAEEANAFSVRHREMVVGTPSKTAIEMMLAYAGFDFAYDDWLDGMQVTWEGLQDYRRGLRISLLATHPMERTEGLR
jgi:predicted nicotinamide N-methyase